MRGGKRERAGRKGYGPTKIYRLPVALEQQIAVLLADYKAGLTAAIAPDNSLFENVTESKDRVTPMFPVLTKDQLRRFRQWLVMAGFIHTMTDARKRTDNPRRCQATFLTYAPYLDQVAVTTIEDILALYVVE